MNTILLKPLRAFTLIETMVAITVLSLAVAGPLLTANRAVIVAYTARDQLIAAYLAEEGIEYVRAMRDNVYLADYQSGDTSGAWDDFVNTSGANVSANIGGCRPIAPATKGYCQLDPRPTLVMGVGVGSSLSVCSGSCASPPPLCETGTLYTQESGGACTAHPGGKTSIFSRTITFEDVTDGSGTITEERITATVTWSSHAKIYNVTSKDVLTPWEQ